MKKKAEMKMIKTEDALNSAMAELLQHHTIDDILVSDICEKAKVSRSVFYAHFEDKFDLLNHYRRKP